MASLLASATDAAHHAAATLLTPAQVKPGSTIPTAVPVKEDSPTDTFTFEGLAGLNVFVSLRRSCLTTHSMDVVVFFTLYAPFGTLFFSTFISGVPRQVGVPGAFTGTCSAQIPGYIDAYEQFKAKGVKNIYVVGVNDVFVMKYVLPLHNYIHSHSDCDRAWKQKLAPSGSRTHDFIHHYRVNDCDLIQRFASLRTTRVHSRVPSD